MSIVQWRIKSAKRRYSYSISNVQGSCLSTFVLKGCPKCVSVSVIWSVHRYWTLSMLTDVDSRYTSNKTSFFNIDVHFSWNRVIHEHTMKMSVLSQRMFLSIKYMWHLNHFVDIERKISRIRWQKDWLSWKCMDTFFFKQWEW